ncbi:MAG TPA: VOC family protein [Acidimicrobiales bacterium]|nr:VOC family protein [Acidimicrobiales bacterium]
MWQLDHVQVAIRAGSEALCDEFYVGVLGFDLVAKPPVLAARGGRWYRHGLAQLHLGVEEDFRPAKKAHPALLVDDYDALRARLVEAHYDVRDDDAIANQRRFYVDDPVGNRLELIDAAAWLPR